MDDKKPVTGYSGPYRGRNDYYRDGVHTLFFIVKFEAVVMIFLTIVLAIYLCTRQNNDRYFAETIDGRAIQMASQRVPNMARDTISDWAATTASEVMTFGFNNIDEHFPAVQHDFTPDGWASFKKAVRNSKVMDEIIKTQQLVTAVPLGPPVWKQDGLITDKNGSVFEGWIFDVPILITFRAGSDVRPIQKKVHMVIEKVPTEDNPYAVGIREWDID